MMRAIRRRMDLSQVELAERLGVTQNTISRWESGAVAMQHPVILEMALRHLEDQLQRERMGVEREGRDG